MLHVDLYSDGNKLMYILMMPKTFLAHKESFVGKNLPTVKTLAGKSPP